MLTPEPREELEPAHVPKYEVAENQVEGASDPDDRQGIGARADRNEVVLEENLGKPSAQARLIVDDKHTTAADGPAIGFREAAFMYNLRSGRAVERSNSTRKRDVAGGGSCETSRVVPTRARIEPPQGASDSYTF